jgi:hypothetical protein
MSLLSPCYSACGVAWGACYASAGAVAGTIAAPLAGPVLLACNAAESICMKACFTAQIAPILSTTTVVPILALTGAVAAFVKSYTHMQKKHAGEDVGGENDGGGQNGGREGDPEIKSKL